MGKVLSALSTHKGEYVLPPESTWSPEDFHVSKETLLSQNELDASQFHRDEWMDEEDEIKVQSDSKTMENSKSDIPSVEEMSKEVIELATLVLRSMSSEEWQKWLATNPVLKEHGERMQRVVANSQKLSHEDRERVQKNLQKSPELLGILEEKKWMLVTGDHQQKMHANILMDPSKCIIQ